MPLFDAPEQLRSTGEREWRTNNKLFRNDLEPTGDKWLPDPRLPNRFLYHFGGEFDNHVVIPKGKVVSIVPGGYRVKDFPSGKDYPALTIANGGEDVVEIDQQAIDSGKGGTPQYTRVANIPVGIADRNIYKNIPDTFYGNEPYFRRYGYFELPHILDPEEAAEMKWGCVVGDIDHTDYVKPNKDGNLVKWDPDKDDPRQRVAQVLFIDHNIPPEGWLQWVMGGDLDQYLQFNANQRDLRHRGYRPEDLLANQGYPYNPKYGEWTHYNQGKGIPGLTDGSYVQTEHRDEHLGTIPATAGVGDRFYFHVEHKPMVEGTLVVKIDGKVVEPEHIDLRSGLVVLTVPEDEGAAVTGTVTATYKATGQVPGLPSNWNFKGVVGGVRLALCIGG